MLPRGGICRDWYGKSKGECQRGLQCLGKPKKETIEYPPNKWVPETLFDWICTTPEACTPDPCFKGMLICILFVKRL